MTKLRVILKYDGQLYTGGGALHMLKLLARFGGSDRRPKETRLAHLQRLYTTCGRPADSYLKIFREPAHTNPQKSRYILALREAHKERPPKPRKKKKTVIGTMRYTPAPVRTHAAPIR